MVELRKRKAPEQAAAPAPAPKKQSAISKVTDKVKAAIGSKAVAVGDTIELDTFGGEIETNAGEKTSLKKLVESSKGGVVLFTYPKASTPGCTKQACIFRDEYTPLTATGYSIYGLSSDSPKANTTFKEKQKLPYPLLCDPSQTLIGAIGMKKPPKSTTRGVFVVDKSGKVLAAESGSPDGTVAVVRKLVQAGAIPGDAVSNAPVANGSAKKEDVEKAEVAADVADTAEKLDSKEAAPVAAS